MFERGGGLHEGGEKFAFLKMFLRGDDPKYFFRGCIQKGLQGDDPLFSARSAERGRVNQLVCPAYHVFLYLV